ncbi:MAG: hypothetical protein JO263_12375 [Candidatus Eremiobacteraeota bacterium]|nr:hypothetical protein [Candidatus Eremiobacteraeota bacterium]
MSDGARRFSTVAAIVAVAGVPVVASFLNLATPVFPFGQYGFSARGDGSIVSVVPSSSAADAHIKAGDRLDLRAMSPQERIAAHWALTLAGRSSRFLFTRGPARSVRLTARRSTTGTFAFDTSFVLVWALADIVTLLIAVALVLRIPSRMTWAFLIDACGEQSGSSILIALLSPVWVAAYSTWYGILGYLSCPALAVFALRFPSDRVAGIGALADRWLLWAGAALAVPVVVSNIGFIYFAADTDAIEAFLILVGIAFYGLTLFIFIARYLTENLYQRARMAWVIASFLVGYAGVVVIRIGQTAGFAPPREATLLLLSLKVLVPIAVAYAILTQRIVSIRFFINRAAIVVVLAVISIGSVALLDWTIVRFLGVPFSSKGAAVFVAADVAAVIVLALCMPALYRVIRDAVYRTLFRREYVARQHLLKLAQRFATADSAQAIGEDLVWSIAGNLEMGSIAVFVRRADGTFWREASKGWTEDNVLEEPDAQRLASAFEKRRDALPLTELHLVSRGIPSGDAQPVVGFPIFVGGRLSRFVLFSGHPYGLDLDPSERRLLGNVTRAASHGFARLSQL